MRWRDRERKEERRRELRPNGKEGEGTVQSKGREEEEGIEVEELPKCAAVFKIVFNAMYMNGNK